jgi:hypothetical protein
MSTRLTPRVCIQVAHAPADNALFLLFVMAPASQPSPRIRALGLRPATPQGACRCDALIGAGVRRARRLLSLRSAAKNGKALQAAARAALATVRAVAASTSSARGRSIAAIRAPASPLEQAEGARLARLGRQAARRAFICILPHL